MTAPPLARSPYFRAPALVAFLAVALSLAGCGQNRQTVEQAAVGQTFSEWKTAMIDRKTDQAINYFPHSVDAYFSTLNAAPPEASVDAHAAPPRTPPSASPGVDHLLREALAKKVPVSMRPNLTLSILLKRIAEKNLFNPRDVRQIELGPISIQGDHANAEVYYQGTLTALRLPFIKEDNAWKIDVLGLLPYAEVLMRVDRAIKGETEAQQVDQLVSKLPSL